MSTTHTIKQSSCNFIYDPNEAIGNELQYNKELKRSILSTADVKKVPSFNNFFSEMENYPNNTKKISYKNLIPPWYMKSFEQYKQHFNSFITRFAGIGCDSKHYEHLIPEHLKDYPDPEGKDRYRYTTISRHPGGNAIPPDIELKAKQLKDAYFERIMHVEPEMTRSIGTQTMYRDSCVQTDPYSPDFVLRPGDNPEILSLIPLSYRNGLPPGLHEVKLLERTRKRRQIENYIDTLDPKNFNHMRRKQKILQKLEMQEWEIREEQIDELQIARMKVIIDLINERRTFLAEMHKECVARFYREKNNKRKWDLNKTYYEYEKEVRRTIRKRAKIQIHFVKETKIDHYKNPTSSVWAPLTRFNQFLDKGSQRYVVQSRFIDSYQGLVELENSVPSFILNPHLKVPKFNIYTKDGYKKKRYRIEDELAELYNYLKNKDKMEKMEKEKPYKFLKIIDKPENRPKTPTLDFGGSQFIDYDLSLLTLEKMIRGRAIQTMMYEGTIKHLDLISELRSTHAIQQAEIELIKQEKAVVIALQRTRLAEEHKNETMEEVFNFLKGVNLGDTFDYLTKELIRLQEERRIHAFIMMAIRERRIREAEESGLRQLEERRRREEDEIFKQIVKMHQTTVDSYLQDLVEQNINWTSENWARFQVDQLAQKINDIAYENEKNMNYLQTEEIVADIVHHFLIPEVHKKTHREMLELKQKKYLLAAHKEIVTATEDVVQYKTRPVVQISKKTVSSTNVPPPSTNEQTPTTNRPASSTNEPARTPNQLLPSANEPAPSINEPAPYKNEPITTLNDSATSPNEPVITLNEPEPSLNESAPSLNEPTPSSNEPTPSTNQPESSTNQPAPSSNEPAPSSNEPTPSTNQLEPSTNEPAPTQNEPEISPNEPEPFTNEPAPSTNEPAPILNDSATSPNEPVITLNESATFPNQPAPSTNEPAHTLNESAISPNETAVPPNQQVIHTSSQTDLPNVVNDAPALDENQPEVSSHNQPSPNDTNNETQE